MFTVERQRLILAALGEAGRATVADLARRFGVSDDTVRRDLQALADRGLLVKARGGAVALAPGGLTHAARTHIAPEAKARIGRAAAAAISPDQTLMLDAGSTVLEAALHLPPGPFLVVTHALDVVVCLGGRSDVRLVLAGGEWVPGERLFHGALTSTQIAAYRADVAIMGACALDLRLGVTAAHAGDAQVKRAMLEASRRAILLADRTKLGRHEPFAVAPLSAFDLVITDQAIAAPPGGPEVRVVTANDDPG